MDELQSTTGSDSRARLEPGIAAQRFIVISKFKVANGMMRQVREAFINRPHDVDRVPGFAGMEVISPADEPDEFWLLTYWTSQAAFQQWHASDQYRAAHIGIPHGLRLEPGSTLIRHFTHICF